MSRISSCLILIAGLIATGSLANASTINFSGSFIFDDDVQFFAYQTATGGNVTVSTSSFADGGFAPILALYDSSGALIFYADGVANNDCSVANQADVLGTGYCYDASLSWDSVAGDTYYIALSQYDNFPLYPGIPVAMPLANWNNPSTFNESGNNFFTATSPFGPGCGQSGFCLNDGHARGTFWDVTFTGPDDLLATPVPETSTVFLILGGLAMLCGRLLKIRKHTVRP